MERKSVRSNKDQLASEIMENGGEKTVILHKPQSLKEDWRNIGLLVCLYTLQGIPLGLSAAIPMILQNRGATYTQQAEFSFVTWPFSVKLLWAPLVDSIYSSRIGRRKTWLVPTQYLIGLFMLLLSGHVDQWLGRTNDSGVVTQAPNIGILTLVFFVLNFLAATQDIAVDGWALTMLHKDHVGHASTCNSVGQTAGFFLSYVLFMAFESASFCNTYLRGEPSDSGIVTLPGFLTFWGYVFVVTTTLVAVLKKEVAPLSGDSDNRDIKVAYKSLIDILSLGPIKTLVLILLTCKVGFSATDSVMSLKLVESGIPKERLGLMVIPMIPIQLMLPVVIAKYTTGPRPLAIFLKAIPYRLAFGLIAAVLVYATPLLVPHPTTEGLPLHYVLILFVCYALHQVCVYCMFVSIMAFFAKISDSSVGGTYMTLLNTVTNLGGNWPAMLSLYFVDRVTWKRCVGGAEALDNECRNFDEKEFCVAKGGKCVTLLDGFYVETVICCVIGVAWLMWGRKQINYVQSLSENSWAINKSRRRKR